MLARKAVESAIASREEKTCPYVDRTRAPSISASEPQTYGRKIVSVRQPVDDAADDEWRRQTAADDAEVEHEERGHARPREFESAVEAAQRPQRSDAPSRRSLSDQSACILALSEIFGGLRLQPLFRRR